MLVLSSGIGIPLDMLDKIFEPFEQVDNSKSRRYGGTGLGLNMALNLAKAHGGDLKVRSVLGQGTVFTIQLPALKDDEDAGFRGMDAPMEGKKVCNLFMRSQLWLLNSNPFLQNVTNLATEGLQGVVDAFQSISCGVRHAMPSPPSPLQVPTLDSEQDLQPDVDDTKAADAERDALRKRKRLASLERRESRLTVMSWMNNTKTGMSQPYMPGSHAADDDKAPPKQQIELLSVDNDPVNQKVMEDILGDSSCRIATAMSGTEALEILKDRFERDGTSSFPDLILMDVMMPGMTGLETTQIIRENYPMAEMPIIMVRAGAPILHGHCDASFCPPRCC